MTRLEFYKQMRRFVQVWQRSNSVEQVAKKLGVEKNVVQVWSVKCKRHKVELKEMPRVLVGKRKTPPTLLKKHWKKLRAIALDKCQKIKA